MRGHVRVAGRAQVAQVIGALASSSGFAGGLHGGQQQRDQDPDDRDDHQQFDERKTVLPFAFS